MSFSRGVRRLLAALAMVALIFGAYGASETREALRYGTSLHDGVESLILSAFFLLIAVVVFRLKSKRGSLSAATPRQRR